MAEETQLVEIYIAEGSIIKRVVGKVVKRGVAGPGGLDYWIVETPPTVFVEGTAPTSYLIIGPGGRDVRLKKLDTRTFQMAVCHIMLDETGRGRDIDSFDFSTVLDFGRGHITRLD